MMPRTHRTLTTAGLSLLLALQLSPASWAASAQQDGYGEGGGSEVIPEEPEAAETQPETAQSAAPAPAATSSLPFTGLEAGLIGIAGVGLVGVGMSLRRAGRQQL
jgi:hypothetical protein